MSRASANDAWDHWRAAAVRTRWLSQAEERELISLAQTGDRKALQTLCGGQLRLVMQIARQYQRSGVSLDDLVSEGWLGLIEAVSRFDLTQTTRLSTYASWWIKARVRGHVFRYRNVVTPPSTVAARVVRSRMIRAERDLGQRLGRAPTVAEVAAELGTDEDEVWDASASYKAARSLADDAAGPAWEPRDQGPTPEEQVSRRELQTLQRSRVSAALATLAERDREIVSAHFSSEDVTLAHLGGALGVSRQRVSQIVKRVCKQLERDLRGVALESAH